MHDINLYEKKMISDVEFPVQMFVNRIEKPGMYCPPHWHEHIEMHYLFKGQGTFHVNQKPIPMQEGSLLIINSNELHMGISDTINMEALVIIFEMKSFSKEVAEYNVIFKSLIEADQKLNDLCTEIYEEGEQKKLGYKLAMKGMIYELISYLLRNYVVESQSAWENTRRNKNLKRLNTVLQYIQDHYNETITNRELADLIHVSEYRFCHIFKESMGQSPLSYINEVRLKKAYSLLEQKTMTISEIASIIGFKDYNNFGRQFRKYYGFPPSKVWEM
ncbi:MAG: AraC family transcriptional regulator [Clostridiales bacterium]|nr:AraC family transcriptional regulator [Clostridiales bacterium]